MKTKNKLDYKWIILTICFLMTFVCLGFCSGNKGLYLTAITEALGIKRSLFSINDSCRFVASALINLFFGSLVGRFGVRKMTAFGFVSLIASMLIYAYASNIFVFYIGGILLGIGLSFTTITMASSIVRRWFKKDVGKYTGIVFAANGIGGAVAAQIASPMINEVGNPFGYRTSYLVVVLILFVVGTLAVIFLREKPQDDTPLNVTTKKKGTPENIWYGIEYETAKKRPYFYLSAIMVLLTGFILQGITGIYAAHMKDVGLSAGYIATVVSVFSLSLTFSKLAVGALYDRFGLRMVLVLCQGSTVLAFLAMVLLNPSSSGMVLAMVFALFYAIALPLETLVIPLIVNDMFGAASYDKILGIFCAMNYTGYALGIPIVNLCYDIFGSYKPILITFSILMIPICIVFQIGICSAHKEKASITF